MPVFLLEYFEAPRGRKWHLLGTRHRSGTLILLNLYICDILSRYTDDELPPSLLHPGRGEEEAEQEASRSRRRQRRRRRRRPSRTERAAAPRVRPPPAPIQQPRRSHTAGQLRPRRVPARPSPAQLSPGTGRPGGRPAPEGAGRGGRMPKPTLLLRGGWERERSPGDSELGRQFRDWCLRTYGDSAKTKTVTRSKYQRIAEVLQGGGGTGAGSGPAAGEKGKFQFWVRSKGFRLGSGREPKMGQVVYVPVKTGSVADGLSEPEGISLKRVAVVFFFFDIIYSMHVESSAEPGNFFKHAGQKKTYRAPGCGLRRGQRNAWVMLPLSGEKREDPGFFKHMENQGTWD
ncbi:PREDICTED: uncharacterized protein LOC105582414 [Cercocebus atys]|uniref:uncharacterized protein LOC105582414 n=1 Tax=Cercocebus atys TaxID=9531 RepID=UPI0005F520DF|nr:PREDICTED: uncharacterized protein LOC105582414 [Cercocebus atys]